MALGQVRTASGQVLTPPFRPIRDAVSVRWKIVLFYDAPEELEQVVNSKQLRIVSARALLFAKATAS